MDEYMMNAS